MDFGQYGLSETTIELIKQKALEGNLIFQQNSRTGSNGTVVSYTPVSGKNFILIFANYQHVSSAANGINVSLKNDTNVRESHEVTVGTSISGLVKFEVYGDVLTGNGSKKYEISGTGLAAGTTVYGNLCGYLEDT